MKIDWTASESGGRRDAREDLKGCSQGKPPNPPWVLGGGGFRSARVGQPETGVRLQTVTNRRSRRVRYPCRSGAIAGRLAGHRKCT
jgi:hypothetical protein